MADVRFVGPGDQLPEPTSEDSHFFDRSARDGFRRQMVSLARRRNSPLFVATENDNLISIGLAKTHRVLAVEDDEVRLSESHARHRRSPGVALTAGHWYEMAIDPGSNVILEARESEPQEPPAPPPTARFEIDLKELPSLGLQVAEAFFSSVRRQPHIPFQYPLNGCWARAHEMCRLIEHHFDGDPRDVVAKIWNKGRLIVATDNSPELQVVWDYHVAPVVRVGEELAVLDPALFERPVSVEEWRRRQSDLSKVPIFTTRHAYDLVEWESESFVEESPGVNQELLQLLWVALIGQVYKNGPLPYR